MNGPSIVRTSSMRRSGGVSQRTFSGISVNWTTESPCASTGIAHSGSPTTPSPAIARPPFRIVRRVVSDFIFVPFGSESYNPLRPISRSVLMERKKASDYPQELLHLFHEYQHGDLGRRTFLERIGKFAVGGLTAMAIFEEMRPNYAWAQQVPKDDPRIKVETVTVQSPQGNGTIKGVYAKP